MNTTPIEKCAIGAHAQRTVDIATKKGWSNFSIFPNGNLYGIAPDGQESHVPDYAQREKDAAPLLLAAAKRIAAYGNVYRYRETEISPYEQLIAAIAAAESEGA